MSKQYLTAHTVDDAHPADIFSLAVTHSSVVSASGAPALQVHSTLSSSFPHVATLPAAHALGCHHVCASADGARAASVGFGGEARLWRRTAPAPSATDGGQLESWDEDGSIEHGDTSATGELWAPALSGDGRYFAATTFDGKIKVWDLEAEGRALLRTYETRGSFGLCVDMSSDSTMTATGHVSGNVYVFINSTGKLQHSLPSLHGPVRSVRFSPMSTLVAATGDSRIVALFDAKTGEQVASLSGHQSWVMCLDWSSTGEWLASGGWDGQVRVWSTERRECVAVLRDAAGGGGTVGKCIWALRWLPKVEGRRGESFAVAGAGKGISFYREAAGT